MKKLVLTVVLVALLAAAVVGGQALASSKPADVTVSEETSAILGSSYWGYPLRMKTFEGCFLATDYPDGYEGYILEESYPGVRHVSVTIGARNFNLGVNDWAFILSETCSEVNLYTVDQSTDWVNPGQNFDTFEFNTDNWIIQLNTDIGSHAVYEYAVTITYPSNQW
jgi:hypothetical protein